MAAEAVENTEIQPEKNPKNFSKKGCNVFPFVIYYKGLL